MKYKKYLIISFVTLMLLLDFRYTILYKIVNSQEMLVTATAITLNKDTQKYTTVEERGTPTYDYIIGNDGLPHFRVFFWIPKNADNPVPYANKGINTKVSRHGSVEKWSIVVTDKVKEDTKLVFIYVPKTFVIIYGKGFEKVIHLKYQMP